MKKDMIAYECNDCNVISVIPNGIDSCVCLSCNGPINPIGKAKVYGKSIGTLMMGIKVDTTELDEALEKAERLQELVDSVESPHK